jgi:hypothetical protein
VVVVDDEVMRIIEVPVGYGRKRREKTRNEVTSRTTSKYNAFY